MTRRIAKEFLVIDKEDAVLRSFIERLRASKKLVVQLDKEEFLIELQPLQVSDEARKLLSRGGPIQDRDD
ncbi:hypothetical protein QA648_27345 (plasmid) [Rhizobium sp. CB3171]|uniref:hypothetical protein n=1 Tax=Rhizobium sp. CB3171 TaxID=3039157 RepID=UPI0024B208CC|nr:hypothetical protein [Rhizobium sp. CB3171]WFU04500.1 hypothetical protein QA648_27345 [Rhizobium sp. CB3171]